MRRRRRGCGPFQGPAAPGVVLGRFPFEKADDQISEKDQNSQPKDVSKKRGYQVDRCEMRQIGIRIDPARHAGEPGEVKNEKRAVEAEHHEPELYLAQLFRQHAAGDFRIPVIKSSHHGEKSASQQSVVKMRHNEIAVGKRPVDGNCGENHSAQTADRELYDEGNAEQHGRVEADRAAPHGGDPVENLDPGGDGDQHG